MHRHLMEKVCKLRLFQFIDSYLTVTFSGKNAFKGANLRTFSRETLKGKMPFRSPNNLLCYIIKQLVIECSSCNDSYSDAGESCPNRDNNRSSGAMQTVIVPRKQKLLSIIKSHVQYLPESIFKSAPTSAKKFSSRRGNIVRLWRQYATNLHTQLHKGPRLQLWVLWCGKKPRTISAFATFL